MSDQRNSFIHSQNTLLHRYTDTTHTHSNAAAAAAAAAAAIEWKSVENKNKMCNPINWWSVIFDIFSDHYIILIHAILQPYYYNITIKHIFQVHAQAHPIILASFPSVTFFLCSKNTITCQETNLHSRIQSLCRCIQIDAVAAAVWCFFSFFNFFFGVRRLVSLYFKQTHTYVSLVYRQAR